MNPKKASLLVVVLLATFSFAFMAFAKLEVPLPQVGTEVLSETPILPDYLRYLFSLVIGLSGLIIFGTFIYAGFRYLTSAGNPASQNDAKDRVFSALLGVGVILASWLLLNTINPHLVKITLTKEPPLATTSLAGIYLCKTASNLDDPKNCFGPYLSDNNSLDDEIYNEATYVRINNPSGATYGVVLHEDQYRKGKCAVMESSGSIPSALNKRTSSITIISLGGTASGEGVTLYEKKDYNNEEKCTSCGRWPDTGGYKGGERELETLNQKGNSIKINGNYTAILFQHDHFEGICQVFRASDPYLNDDPIEVCGITSNMGCFTSVKIY